MKKNQSVELSASNVSYGYGYVLSNDSPDRIVGKIIGIIEACGMTEKQEESVKNLIRGAVWEVFTDAVFIKPERHTEIRNLYWEEKNKTGNTTPMAAI